MQPPPVVAPGQPAAALPDHTQLADTAESLLDDARRRLEEECERAEAERQRAEKMAERLRALGGDPDAA